MTDDLTPSTAPDEWTLTAPDGRQWRAESGLKCAAAERRDRVPDSVAMARIYAAADEAQREEMAALSERLCRHAMSAKACPPDSLVVTAYAIKRILAAPAVRSEGEREASAARDEPIDKQAFWVWLPRAYRDGDKDLGAKKFTAHNMEVAFNAGLAAAASVPAATASVQAVADVAACLQQLLDGMVDEADSEDGALRRSHEALRRLRALGVIDPTPAAPLMASGPAETREELAAASVAAAEPLSDEQIRTIFLATKWPSDTFTTKTLDFARALQAALATQPAASVAGLAGAVGVEQDIDEAAVNEALRRLGCDVAPVAWVIHFNDPDPQLDIEFCRECPPAWAGKAEPLYEGPGVRPFEARQALARLAWLHSAGSYDVDGYEWGIFRVKWVNGQPAEVWQTNADFSDLDAAQAASTRAGE